MKSTVLTPIATIAAFIVIEVIFGRTVSLWSASVVLAFCIGALWGAGDQIRKHRSPE